MQKSRFTAKQESAAAAFKNVLISWRERKIEIFYTTNAAEPRQKKIQDGQYPTTTTIFSPGGNHLSPRGGGALERARYVDTKKQPCTLGFS